MLSVEIESLEALRSHLDRGMSLTRCTISSVDLDPEHARLAQADLTGTILLGCTMSSDLDAVLRANGALVFPMLPELPFNPYRADLYSPTELFDTLVTGEDYSSTTDSRIYVWQRCRPTPTELPDTLAMSLHDHAISDELDEFFETRDERLTVGIMGGHAAARGSDNYRAAALLAARLTREGRLVSTGGGPGAMEAANLGALLSSSPQALDEALALLGSSPDFHEDITGWARAAFEVRDRWPLGGTSVGIPTWFYGHEPPNAFATHIGKYFSNAIREDTLLQRCRGGIVYLPGAAGTVQEVFQAATASYYAPETTPVAPMVLVGIEHWTRTLPVWPLLEALGRGRAMGGRIHLVDDLDAAAAVLA